MKKLVIFVMIIGLLAAGCGKNETEENVKIPEVEIQEDTQEEASQTLTFEDLVDLQFDFSSGAGG